MEPLILEAVGETHRRRRLTVVGVVPTGKHAEPSARVVPPEGVADLVRTMQWYRLG